MLQKFIFLLVLSIGFPLIPVYSQEQSDEKPPTPYVLVITGNELLKGIYADGHTQFITSTLNPLGCRCVASLSVGDSEEAMLDALDYASEHGKFIIVTGGLGPTPADITRKTVSKYTGIPIAIDDEILENMSKRFRTPKEKLRENLVRQTYMPTKGSYLQNTVGSAYGLVFDDGGDVVICLPGPPRELQAMVKNALVPYLADRFGIRKIGASLQMRFVGIGESSIDHTIQNEMKLPSELMTEYKFDMGRVDVTFSLPHETPEDHQKLKLLEDELLSHIQEYFYSDDGSTLEAHILKLLQSRKETITLAEIGSDGAIAASLGEVSADDGIYLGGVVAPDHKSILKLLNTGDETAISDEVSEESTVEMAKQICKMIGSDWAIAVSQVQQEDDRSTVWVAIGSDKKPYQTYQIGTRGRGASAQKRLVTDVLNRLRKRINP